MDESLELNHLFGNPEARESVRRSWPWYLLLGIVLILLGPTVGGLPYLMAAPAKTLIGAVVGLGGLFKLLHALISRNWTGFFLILLESILSLAAGLYLLLLPLQGELTLPLFLSAFLGLEGLVRIVLAYKVRPMSRWGWFFFSGLTGLVLGALAWLGWVGPEVRELEVLVGIDLIVIGWSMAVFSTTIKRT
jgi:uncharacterized membrane protein HdeD (DUF308 family)